MSSVAGAPECQFKHRDNDGWPLEAAVDNWPRLRVQASPCCSITALWRRGQDAYNHGPVLDGDCLPSFECSVLVLAPAQLHPVARRSFIPPFIRPFRLRFPSFCPSPCPFSPNSLSALSAIRITRN